MDNRTSLVRRIHALDFALVELNLFLDTHPCNTEALHRFHALQAERTALVETYEAQFGPYDVTVDRVKGDRFTWVMGPWPWEYGKEC